jgi:hypothetical protein
MDYRGKGCKLQQTNCFSGCFLYGSLEVMKGKEIARQGRSHTEESHRIVEDERLETSPRTRRNTARDLLSRKS